MASSEDNKPLDQLANLTEHAVYGGLLRTKWALLKQSQSNDKKLSSLKIIKLHKAPDVFCFYNI